MSGTEIEHEHGGETNKASVSASASPEETELRNDSVILLDIDDTASGDVDVIDRQHLYGDDGGEGRNRLLELPPLHAYSTAKSKSQKVNVNPVVSPFLEMFPYSGNSIIILARPLTHWLLFLC